MTDRFAPSHPEVEDSLDIAVIGMDGRFPGARDLDEYWRVVRDGRSAVTFFSEEELLARGADPAVVRDPDHVPAGNLLADTESFDAEFFGYSPREAEIMDPQHRVLLESAWAAVENAGYDPRACPGLVGVYAGAGTNTYMLFNLMGHQDVVDAAGGNQLLVANRGDFLASRVAYKLGLEGPAVNVQSACSTSLVAVVLACQALLAYQCDVAVAGGASVDVLKDKGYLYRPDGIFSPDGHSRPFDAAAKGTVGGNGVGVVVLKRLHEALADGDHVHAVVKGSAVNNDGARRAGFTAPSADSQALVITSALAGAEVEPDTVGYVESHGTGTVLGDPVEFAALKAAYGAGGARGTIALGAVKPNIGHLDAAAGVAGLIKAVHVVGHGLVPPLLNFERANPRIALDGSPFFVPTELSSWPVDGVPRRAGVSSFGLGGTNAHVVVEEPPPREPSAPSDDAQLVVLSARTAEALEAATDRLADHLRAHPDVSLADVAFTLQTGRRPFPHRRAVVGRTAEDVREALEARDDGRVLTSVAAPAARRPVAFMFTGFGEQYPGFAREPYLREPVFRDALDRCAKLLAPMLGTDIRDHVLEERRVAAGGAGFDLRRMLLDPVADDHPLAEPRLGYPVLFAVEYALAELWRSRGVVPDAMIGHSLGEYVAACLAGVFSLPDALRLVVARAELITEHGAGAMLAVPLTEEAVVPLLDDEVALAAVNDPGTCVVSGTDAGIARLAERLGADGVVSRRLRTRFAFHSPAMDAVVEPYAEIVRGVRLNAPRTPFLSNVTGTWIEDAEATDPGYWARHLRRPVRFADGVAELWRMRDVVLVEVGPGRALTSAAVKHPASRTVADRVVLPSLPDAFSNDEPRAVLLRALGGLWLAGAAPHWTALHESGARHRVPLPSYPFERRRYWLDPVAPARAAEPARRVDRDGWYHVVSWRRLGEAEPDPAADPAADRWLVFADESGVGAAVADRLTGLGAAVAVVEAGQSWARCDGNRFTVDPSDPEHFRRLADALRVADAFPNRVVHCWTVDRADAADDRAGATGLLDRGFGALVRWAQAAEPELATRPNRWDVVGTQVHDVLGVEPIAPVKAALHGVCRVAPQEYSSLRCAEFDVPVPAVGDVPVLADRLLAELLAAPHGGVVALRGDHRWGQVFEPTRLRPAASPVRPGGTYLVTGGLGKIGLVVAASLADAAPGVRLVLVGRTGLADHGAPTADDLARAEAVRALTASGAEVLVRTADVADEAQVAAVVDEAVRRFGAVHGVVHAAGATGEAAHRVLADLTEEEWGWHFEPKLHGVHALERALAGQPLDFAVLCSSVASVLGGLGFTAYAGANAFLDAHARSRSGPVRWTSLNWEAWRFGDAVPDQGLGRSVRLTALDPAEGREVFERVLAAGPRPQVLISTTDLAARVAEWTTPVAAGAGEPTARRYARPELRNPYVAPADDTERLLAGVWQELLGVERVGVHDNFFELGGSSLLGLQVVHKLRTDLGLAVPLTAVYEGPTIRTLARLILGLD